MKERFCLYAYFLHNFLRLVEKGSLRNGNPTEACQLLDFSVDR